MTMMYSKKRWEFQFEQRKDENQKILLRELAVDELPEELKAKAREVDKAPIPPHFIWATHVPPKEGENIFGDYQKPGHFQDVDEKGAPPRLYKAPKV